MKRLLWKVEKGHGEKMVVLRTAIFETCAKILKVHIIEGTYGIEKCV